MLEQESDGVCVGVHAVRAQMFRKCDYRAAGDGSEAEEAQSMLNCVLRSLLAIISNK